MFNMGYSISYTELRQFITSVAIYINSLQVPSPIGSYLPPKIVSAVHGGNFIVASADNWDHNERTVDGKRTTHAMTSILVQAQTNESLPAAQIQRISSLSLDTSQLASGDFSQIQEYKEHVKRPEHVFMPPVMIDELSKPGSGQYLD